MASVKKKKTSSNISQDALSRSGLEVYKTKDKNIEKVNEDTEKEGFILHNGQVTEIAYFNEMIDNSFEHDYEDISSNGTASFIKVDEKRFYKGNKVLLKKAHNPKKWKDLKNCLMGFITEQSYTEDGVEIKITGMNKLLEQEKKFNFKKTKISKVLKKIIESSGLKANINTSGLKDEKINYTNISSSGSKNSGDVSEDIYEAAQQICQNCNTDLEKAKAIWKYCHDNISYQGYSNSKKGAEGCFKDKKGNCCDHANLVVKMLKAVDVECAYEHSTSCYGTGHVWAVAYCEGEWYRIDASVKSKGFNQVGNGCTGTRKKTLNF